MSSLLETLMGEAKVKTEAYSEQFNRLNAILAEVKTIQASEVPDLDRVVLLLEEATVVYKSCNDRLKRIKETMELKRTR